jgi:lysophospholipase L1-like esterase
MKKKVLLFFISLFFSIVFAVVFLEVYFKNDFWNGNFFTFDGKKNNTQFDPNLGWYNQPNTVFIQDGIEYTNDSFGFRSSGVDFSKKHILVIGDSIAYGYGVGDNETIPYYLNEKLNEYEVVNLGVVAYGTDQVYLNLERHIDKFNPALIIIFICMANDLEEMLVDNKYGKSKPLFIVDKNKLDIKFGQSLKIDPNNIVLTNSNISPNSCHNVFTKSWTLKQSFFQEIRDTICQTRKQNVLDVQYVALSLFHKIAKLANDRNSKILFALSPPEIKNLEEGGNMGKSDVFHIAFFQKMFSQIKFPYLDFFEVINKRNLNNKELYLDGLHYTPLGNKLFADTIYETIKANEMVLLTLKNESGV